MSNFIKKVKKQRDTAIAKFVAHYVAMLDAGLTLQDMPPAAKRKLDELCADAFVIPTEPFAVHPDHRAAWRSNTKCYCNKGGPMHQKELTYRDAIEIRGAVIGLTNAARCNCKVVPAKKAVA